VSLQEQIEKCLFAYPTQTVSIINTPVVLGEFRAAYTINAYHAVFAADQTPTTLGGILAGFTRLYTLHAGSRLKRKSVFK